MNLQLEIQRLPKLDYTLNMSMGPKLGTGMKSTNLLSVSRCAVLQFQ